MRTKTIYKWVPTSEEDTMEVDVPLFSEDWAQSVLDDLENANWHSARSAFEEFILLLPSIYLQVDEQTKEKMEVAVEGWDSEF